MFSNSYAVFFAFYIIEHLFHVVKPANYFVVLLITKLLLFREFKKNCFSWDCEKSFSKWVIYRALDYIIVNYELISMLRTYMNMYISWAYLSVVCYFWMWTFFNTIHTFVLLLSLSWMQFGCPMMGPPKKNKREI